MRAFISADMECTTGIAAPEGVVKNEVGYDAGTRLTVGDVNAAVESAVTADADEVVINDSRGSMMNPPRDALHDAATSIRGASKPWSMMQGLPPKTDATLFVGYQAMAGTETTVMAADAVPTFENVAGTEDWAYVPAAAVDEVAWWKNAREVERRADRMLPDHEWWILDTDRGFDPR